MKKGMIAAVLVGLVSVPAADAAPVSLDLVPTTQTVGIPAQAQVGLAVSGLAGAGVPSLGAYDLDILYDPTVLSFSSASFGDPSLGNQIALGGGSLNGVDDSVAGTVNVFEVSLASPADLDAGQADAFTLALLTFDTVNVGTSSLAIDVNAFGDSIGDALDVTPSGGSISAVPVPAAAWLFVSAVSALGGIAWRKRPTA